jgi:hypothetical protein
MEDMQVQAEECAIRVFRFATDLLRITRVVGGSVVVGLWS